MIFSITFSIFFIISLFCLSIAFLYYKIISLKLKIFEKVQESENIRHQKIHLLYIQLSKYEHDEHIQKNINQFIKHSFSPLNYSIRGFHIEESRFKNLIHTLNILIDKYNDENSFIQIKTIIDSHLLCLKELQKLQIKKDKYFNKFHIRLLKFLH